MIQKMQGNFRSHVVSCKSDSSGEVQDRRRGSSTATVALSKVGSVKLEGARAPWVLSRSCGEAGHGARGRTGCSRGSGGAGLCAHGLSCHSEAAQTGLRCLPTAKDVLHTHMHFSEGCLGNPASRLASLATRCTRACPRGHTERQKGSRSAAALQEYPRVRTPAEEIKEAKLRTSGNWLGHDSQAGRPEGEEKQRPGGGVRDGSAIRASR